jgi:SAM-dependent methyltransferase
VNAGPGGVFDAALAGRPTQLVGDDGRILPVAVQRWLAPASGEDDWLLDRCSGPTVDLGCGPGRLVAGLAQRGVPALGVDCSPAAVRHCHSRGARVLHRDVFAPLPGEGQWHHVLLADGNIGIGGDPVRLLHRCTSLLRPSGTMLIEVGRPGAGLWQGTARLQVAGIAAGPWFPWAVAGLQALAVLAAHIELRVAHRHYGCRCFIELRLPSRRGMSADGKPKLVPNGVRGK